MKKKHIIFNMVVPLLLWILLACVALNDSYITDGVDILKIIFLILLPFFFSLGNVDVAKNEWCCLLNNLIFTVSNTVGYAIFCWARSYAVASLDLTEKIASNFSFIPLYYTLVLTLICFFIKRYLID